MTTALLLYPNNNTSSSNDNKNNQRNSTKIMNIMNKKYFILSDNILTYHPNEQKTSIIEGLININNLTIVDEMNDQERVISLIDSDLDRNKLSFQFKAMNISTETESAGSQYIKWKNTILSMIHPDYHNKNSTSTTTATSAATAAEVDKEKGLTINTTTEAMYTGESEGEEEDELPPLPLETPPHSPYPLPNSPYPSSETPLHSPYPLPPPDSPATPGTGRSSQRKVAFVLHSSDEEDAGPNTGITRTGRSASRSSADDASSSTAATIGTGKNALQAMSERRKARSTSPSVTPRKSLLQTATTATSSNLLRSNSTERTKSITTTSLLLRRASSILPSDLSLFSSPNNHTDDSVLGQIPTVNIFLTPSNTPISRLLYDNFISNEEDMLNIPTLQDLCYDLGVYYSVMEVKIQVKTYAPGIQGMRYEAFERFWNAQESFR